MPFDPLAHMAILAPLATLIVAMLIDALFGEFKGVPHPVMLLGRVIDQLDERLNRSDRSEAVRKRRGVLMVVLLVGSAILLGLAIEALVAWGAFLWLAEVLLIASLIAQRSLYDHVKDVAVALESGGLDAGRQAVGMIVGRDPDTLDGPGVARASIESLAENFSDGVVAPIFWFIIFGLPGLLAYKTINTLDSMVGYKNKTYLSFGWASARLDDVVNYIPARLTGLLICLVAGGKMSAALRIMSRDAKKHKSPNAGWPEGAMAGALGLKLAGPRFYPGQSVDDPWIGEGRDAANTTDIRKGLSLFVRAGFMNACLISSILYLQ